MEQTKDNPATLTSQQTADLIIGACLESKARDLVLIELAGISDVADYYFIASGRSTRQVKAIAEAISLGVKKGARVLPLGVEGKEDGRWVLIDYGDVVAHVFHEPVRAFYDLEGLWAEARLTQIPSPE